MEAETKSKLTQLVKKAAQRLKDKRKMVPFTMHVESVDMDIVLRPCTRAELIESQEMSTTDQPNRGDRYLVYICAKNPSLPEIAKQLQQEGTINEFLEVMDMFTDQEVAQMSVQIVTAAGFLGGGASIVKAPEAMREAAKNEVKN